MGAGFAALRSDAPTPRSAFFDTIDRSRRNRGAMRGLHAGSCLSIPLYTFPFSQKKKRRPSRPSRPDFNNDRHLLKGDPLSIAVQPVRKTNALFKRRYLAMHRPMPHRWPHAPEFSVAFFQIIGASVVGARPLKRLGRSSIRHAGALV
jgi:hypothetical protein